MLVSFHKPPKCVAYIPTHRTVFTCPAGSVSSFDYIGNEELGNGYGLDEVKMYCDETGAEAGRWWQETPYNDHLFFNKVSCRRAPDPPSKFFFAYLRHGASMHHLQQYHISVCPNCLPVYNTDCYGEGIPSSSDWCLRAEEINIYGIVYENANGNECS